MSSGSSKPQQTPNKRLPEAPAPIVQTTGFGAGTMAGGGQDNGTPGQTPTERRWGVPWNPVAAVLYAILVFIVAQFIAAMVVFLYPTLRGQSAQAAEHWLNTSTFAQFWYVLLAEILTFFGIWWFIRRRGSNIGIIGWKRPHWIDPAFALGGFVVYFIGLAVIMAIATWLFPSLNVNQPQELGFDNVAGNVDLTLTFISLVVLPPIVEETVFRGFIFTSLRGAQAGRKRIISAALITSLLFAVAHLQFGNGQPLLWTAAIDTFVLSLVLCYLRQKTGSLWAPIFLHALKNGIAFVALFVLGVS